MLHAKQLPGFQEGAAVLKRDVELQIEKLKANVVHATAHIDALDKLIKQTTPRMRSRREGWLVVKENEQSPIDKMTRNIAALEKAWHTSPEPGKQDIRGGGVMTLNAAGEVIKIDAKLGDLVLSAKEIEKTLLTLKRRGVKLENVSLIVYDQTGKPATPCNANQYLVDKYGHSQVKATASVVAVPPGLSVSTMAKYKSAMTHEQSVTQKSEESSADKRVQQVPVGSSPKV